MFGRLAIVALAVGLASCAGIEPAGRNAQRARPAPTVTSPATTPAPAPAPQVALPPPQTPAATPQRPPTRQSAPVTAGPPPMTTPAPTAAPTPAPTRQTPAAPTVAAPQVAAPPSREPSPTAPRVRSDDDDIVVPGQVQTQVPPPAGDPRNNEERRADVRSWDQCVTQVQGAFDSDPMSPQLTTPEEYCSQSLGMSGRNAVPIARQQRRR